MRTQVIRVEEEHLEQQKEAVEEAGAILRQGGLVAFPTETVYGLGGDALNAASAAKIYAAKGRPSDNPLIVHIACMEDLNRLVSKIPESAKKLAETFWPGPMTLIFPKSEVVPKETTGGLETVAVRYPSHKTACALIKAAGGYVAAPSANTSGKPSPTLAKYVVEDMDGRIDMIIDGGDIPIGLESTIVDCTVEPPMILRPGYITQKMLEEVLGRVDADVTMMHVDADQAPKAPGMKYRHYAPKGDLVIFRGMQEKVISAICERTHEAMMTGMKTGIIATDETMATYRAKVPGAVIKSVGSRLDEAAIAHRLYLILREFDEEEVMVISTECFESEGFGAAIMNRLLKAAGHHVEEV